MEERNAIYVVSDVHLASKHFYEENQKRCFWEFLQKIAEDMHTKEFILNGDIIETWASPIEEVYTLEKIFQHEDVIIFAGLIKAIIAKGIKVVYIIGNHDSRVNEPSLKALLGPEVEVLYTYINYGIHFSHGHKYDYFNSDDPVQPGLPVGYYATRVDHNHDIGFSHDGRDRIRKRMHSVLPDLTVSRKLIAEKTIISSFMTHMFMKARPFKTLFATGSVPRIINENGEGETMHQISARLTPLYTAWAANNSDNYIAATMRCSMTAEYSWFLENGVYGDVAFVVHGHTHDGLTKQHVSPYGVVTYVNNGAWENDRMNYAKFVIDNAQQKVVSHQVVLVNPDQSIVL